MILPDWKLIELCSNSKLVTPYDPSLINPASIDLRLSDQLQIIGGETFTFDRYKLKRGHAVLACTLEYVRIPADYSAVLYMKSSAARIGLDHLLAGWIDPGFEGQLTLELHAHADLDLVAGKGYVQMVLMQMLGSPDRPYGVTGNYQGQTGVTRSVWSANNE